MDPAEFQRRIAEAQALKDAAAAATSSSTGAASTATTTTTAAAAATTAAATAPQQQQGQWQQQQQRQGTGAAPAAPAAGGVSAAAATAAAATAPAAGMTAPQPAPAGLDPAQQVGPRFRHHFFSLGVVALLEAVLCDSRRVGALYTLILRKTDEAPFLATCAVRCLKTRGEPPTCFVEPFFVPGCFRKLMGGCECLALMRSCPILDGACRIGYSSSLRGPSCWVQGVALPVENIPVIIKNVSSCSCYFAIFRFFGMLVAAYRPAAVTAIKAPHA